MSFDERLFGWAWRRVQRLAQSWPRRQRDNARLARRAFAEAQAARLRVIASAAAGRDIELVVVDGCAAVSGLRLLVPAHLDVLATLEENEALYRLIAAHGGARAGGSTADDDDPDPARAAVRELLVVCAVELRLADEWPGHARACRDLAAALVASRRAPQQLSKRGAVVEHLVRAVVGAEAIDEDRGDVAAVVASFVGSVVGSGVVDDDVWRAFDALGGRVDVEPLPCWPRRVPAPTTAITPSISSPTPTGVIMKTERVGRRRPPPKRRRTLENAAQRENPLTHSFEKVHTAEAFQGGQKRADGSDELDDHSAALDEVDLEETVLSDEAAASVYNVGASSGDVVVDDAGGVELGVIAYDEWDARARRYLPGFCRMSLLSPSTNAAAGDALLARVQREQRATISQTRATLLRCETALRWRGRQVDGPEIDVDAAIERMTSVAAGVEGTRRVYQSRRRAGRALAVLVLIDVSLSTDAWVDDRRVLDVERDACVALGVATDGVVDEIAVAAFYSDTHERCAFVEVKSFDDPWSTTPARLAALAPCGYTRLGPAVRHAGARLATCRAARRLLVVLTDGKPSDRDRYEGQHGERDVRQAIREIGRENVEVVAFAVDPRATAAMHEMFSTRATASLDHPAALSAALATALARRVR